MEQKLDIIKCYKEAWQSFKVHWRHAIGGMFIYFAIVYSGSIAEFIGAPVALQYIYWLMYFTVFPPLFIGIIIFTLHLSGVAEPQLQDMLAGFRMYWKSIGLYFLYLLIVFVLSIPFGVIFAFLLYGVLASGYDSYFMLLIILGIISIIFLVSITVRWFLVFYVLADEPETGIIDCLKRSSQITSGNRLRLIGLLLTMIPVMLLGLMAFGLGVFVTIPICMIALARAYLWLKSFHPPLNTIATEQIES